MSYKKKSSFYVTYKEKWLQGSVHPTGQFVSATTKENAEKKILREKHPSHVVKVFNVKAKLKKIS